MTRTLFLFTKKYPFGKGEEFIENELPYLTAQFDHVYLVCLSADQAAQQTKKVPDSVMVIRFNDVASKWRYPLYIIRSIRYLFDAMLWSELRNNWGIKPVLANLYAYARTKTMLRHAKKVIASLHFQPDDYILLYSYWFSDTAHMICLLREWLREQTGFRDIVAISRAHRFDLYPDRNISGTIPFRKYCLEQIDHVFPCSKHGVDYLLQAFPQYADKVSVSYLGTKDAGIQPEKAADAMFHLVTCSNIIPIKRVLLVAQALSCLEQQGYQGIKWTCIGDGPLLPELKQYVETHIHKQKVVFCGALENREVLRLYGQQYVDLFINVSENEGLPVSIMEAQSFGIPSLATAVGGTPEIVLDEITGWLVNEQVSMDTLARKISQVIELPGDRYREIRGNARRHWVETFDAARNYQKFIQDTDQLYAGGQS